MANVKKYTRGQIGGLTRHFKRGQKEDGSYFQFGNQDIDTSKSHLNYNLAPQHDGGQLSFINRRTSEVQCLNRADVNVMCSWVVTAPKDLTEGEYDLFFREAYKFLNDRYADGSDKNVISAYVHMDEISPHLHYAFVPVVHDKKKGIDKVSAKIAVDRLDLQKFHQDLERHMAEVFGREIGILNEVTKDGNKSIDELKRGTAQAEIAKLEAIKIQTAENVSELRSMALNAQTVVNDLEDKKRAVEGQINAIQGQIKNAKTLTLDELTKIKPYSENKLAQKIGSPSMLTVYKDDWDSLLKTAIQRAEVDEDTKQTQTENKRLKKRVNGLLSDKEKLEKDLGESKKQAQTTMTERMEHATLKSQLQRVPKADLDHFLAQYEPQRGKQKTIDQSQGER
jgi:hypothetical protein